MDLSGSLRPLLLATRWLGRSPRRDPPQLGAHANADEVAPFEGYVRLVYQSLAVFRFFSFAMGTGLVFGLDPGEQPQFRLGLVVGAVGLYNVLRVVWRVRPLRYGDAVQWALLAVDAALAISLILLTEGLDSPFLMYSLSPILMASLLMDIRSARLIAGASALSISGAHVAAGLDVGKFPWVLSGNYLAFSLLYTAVCLLITYLPFVANLNWQRRVRAESLSAERGRLRREVHDNVAQTLAFLSLKVRVAEDRASRSKRALTAGDVREIGSAVEKAYVAVRDYLDGTDEREPNATLTAELESIVEQWSRDTKVQAGFAVSGEEAELPSRVTFQLAQIAREALANAAKHAYATRVRVSLDCTPSNLTLRVADNGRGFSTASGPRGHGMNIMSERAALVDGSLDITSTPGEGTEVLVTYSR